MRRLHAADVRLMVSIWPGLHGNGPDQQQLRAQGFLLGDDATYDPWQAGAGTVETDHLDAFRACPEVSFFGVVQVTRAALPLLRTRAGRIVTVSSVGGAMGQPFNEAYCAA